MSLDIPAGGPLFARARCRANGVSAAWLGAARWWVADGVCGTVQGIKHDEVWLHGALCRARPWSNYAPAAPLAQLAVPPRVD